MINMREAFLDFIEEHLAEILVMGLILIVISAVCIVGYFNYQLQKRAVAALERAVDNGLIINKGTMKDEMDQ